MVVRPTGLPLIEAGHGPQYAAVHLLKAEVVNPQEVEHLGSGAIGDDPSTVDLCVVAGPAHQSVDYPRRATSSQGELLGRLSGDLDS